MKRIHILLFTFLTIFSCEKDISLILPIDNKQVEKLIIAATGGMLNTSDSIKLIIPSYALPSDGNVFVGRTGNEPTSVPNEDLQIIGKPITIKIPSDSILKPIQLSFPVNSSSISSDNYFIFLYNGSTYFPIEYSLIGETVKVNIDIINWETTEKKNTTLISEIIIIALIAKQTPPSAEMGLKEISIEDGKMNFNIPNASPSSKILLLVHGWTGRPTVWDELIPKIQEETSPSYTDIWTFGYNSSWSINYNAELLAQYLETYANGSHVDIVAHSMGGLVSRSMIEQFNGAQYINKLITLGTPHKGSPLAVLRYMLGEIVKSSGIDQEYILYDYTSQGFNDLNTNSTFIQQMEKLESPPLPYYAIAATNYPSLWKKVSNFILPGPDDGVVSVSSALGVQGAVTPDLIVQIPVAIAHLKMTKNDPIYEQIISYLE